MHVSQYFVPVGDQSGVVYQKFLTRHFDMCRCSIDLVCEHVIFWLCGHSSVHLSFSILLLSSVPFFHFFLCLCCASKAVSCSLWWCQKKKKVALAWGRYCNSLKHWALLMHFLASKHQQRKGLSRRSKKQRIKQAERAWVRSCQGSKEGLGFTKP